ncbi:hypothetical protein KVR01_009527 [Diaporthe batatas]|uniref:uncharacterized protein n=1 Tax=Diaporthe batatas TaxID=748121 RepID=UPI001D058608|nr:uncharacterized protein KVR01_009527 [Diaporthe batatas]KAG8161263.1 hypothetical protein KVR01_009527 [Diaporthe batatas]
MEPNTLVFWVVFSAVFTILAVAYLVLDRAAARGEGDKQAGFRQRAFPRGWLREDERRAYWSGQDEGVVDVGSGSKGGPSGFEGGGRPCGFDGGGGGDASPLRSPSEAHVRR